MSRRKAGAMLRHQQKLQRTLPSWTDQAACVGHDDPDLWFPERGDDDREHTGAEHV